MVQICPFCKELVSDEDTVCPHCNNRLTFENKRCPFCKKQITGEDTICPHCNSLLIYEYPKQVTAERNKVLLPTGLILLLSALLYWRFQSMFNDVMHGIFTVSWLAGFLVYCVYIGKGDRDFWFGR